MTTQNGYLDENSRPTLTALASDASGDIVDVYADKITHRLLTQSSGGGGTGTWWAVSGTIDGSNKTFTIATAVDSDFILSLARQVQQQNIGMTTWDYSYSVAGGTTTITYTTAPDASLSGQPHTAFVIS